MADPAGMADWVFRAFVAVADSGPGLGVRDVTLLQDWVRRLAGAAAQEAGGLAAACVHIDEHYPALWARHVAQGQAVDMNALAAEWHQWQAPHAPHTHPGADSRATLRRELAALLSACATPVSWLSRLRPGTAEAPIARQQALRALLSGLDEPLRAQVASVHGGEPLAPIEPAPAAAMRLRCVAVLDEARELRTFVFRRLDGAVPVYAPGQFITLTLPGTPHGTLHRSYTLSSSPSRPHTLAITVRRFEVGRASSLLHAHARPGWEVQARGPSGHFSCALGEVPARLLLLAAGSGITPMISMLRWLSDTGAPCDTVLVQSHRTVQDVAFDAEWPRLADHAAGPWARHVVLGSGAPGGRRLDAGLLAGLVPDLASRTAYLCGPQEYLRDMRGLLMQAGVPAQQILEEKFAPTLGGQTPARSGGEVAADIEVRFAASGLSVRARAGERLLDVAEHHAVPLPSACRAGRCGTCWTPLRAGQVRLDDGAGEAVRGGADVRVPACVSVLVEGPLEVLA